MASPGEKPAEQQSTSSAEDMSKVAEMVGTTIARLSPLSQLEFTTFSKIAAREDALLARDDLPDDLRQALVSARNGLGTQIESIRLRALEKEDEGKEAAQDQTADGELLKSMQSKIAETVAALEPINQTDELKELFGDLVGDLTKDMEELEQLDYDQILVKLQKYEEIKPRLVELLETFSKDDKGMIGAIASFGIRNIIIKMEKLKTVPLRRLQEIPGKLQELIDGEWPLDTDVVEKVGDKTRKKKAPEIVALIRVGAIAGDVIHCSLTPFVDPSGALLKLAYDYHQKFTSILSIFMAYGPTIKEVQEDLDLSAKEMESFTPGLTENFRAFVSCFVEYLLADPEDREDLNNALEEMEEAYEDILMKGC